MGNKDLEGASSLRADRAAGLRPQPPSASSQSSIPSAAFSLDALLAMARKFGDAPPPAFLASDPLLPRDHALSFKHDGRDYVGAHPDFWKKLPAAERGQYQSIFAIEIWDLTLPSSDGWRRQFYDALAATLAQGTEAGTAEGSGDE